MSATDDPRVRSVLAIPEPANAIEVSTTYPLSDAAPPARARMGRYARIQLRDFMMSQGVTMLIVALALSVPLWSIGRASPLPFDMILQTTFNVLVGGVIALGTLLSIRGIVSEDTQKGYHRFLFSKPLDVARFYLQALGVRFAGFMLVLLVLALPFALAGVPVAAMLACGALFFVLTSSVGFLISTLTRHDLSFLVLLGALTGVVQAGAQAEFLVWLVPLAKVLPPLAGLGDVFASLMGTPTPATSAGFPLGTLLWIVLYSAACIAGGLAVLRRRAVSA